MERSNQQLLARIAAGDRTAFAEFYDRHAPRVLALLTRWLGPDGDGEDVLQETFWEAWCRACDYDPGRSPPEAWLVLIARSRAVDHLRRRRPEIALSPAHEPAIMDGQEIALERSESARQVGEALAKLPEEQRVALTLAFYSGFTHEQVARHQAVPLGTAKTRIRLAMKRLRDLLTD
jgi:RNA polymerase sigma-70 factor (ECF subfamily)